VGGGEDEQPRRPRVVGKQVLDVFEGEQSLVDVERHERARLDYLVVVGLAHGLSLDDIMDVPLDYLELLDAYTATRLL